MPAEYSNGDDYRSLDDYPKLYGHLLSIDKRLGDVGTSMVWIQFLLSSVLCFVLYLIDWKAKLNIEAGWSTSFTLFLIIIVGSTLFTGKVVTMLEKREYNSLKQNLFSDIDATGINRFELITMMQHDEDLKEIYDALRADAEFFQQ